MGRRTEAYVDDWIAAVRGYRTPRDDAVFFLEETRDFGYAWAKFVDAFMAPLEPLLQKTVDWLGRALSRLPWIR